MKIIPLASVLSLILFQTSLTSSILFDPLFFFLATQDLNPLPVMGNSPHSEAEPTAHHRCCKCHVHTFPSLPVAGQGPVTKALTNRHMSSKL